MEPSTHIEKQWGRVKNLYSMRDCHKLHWLHLNCKTRYKTDAMLKTTAGRKILYTVLLRQPNCCCFILKCTCIRQAEEVNKQAWQQKSDRSLSQAFLKQDTATFACARLCFSPRLIIRRCRRQESLQRLSADSPYEGTGDCGACCIVLFLKQPESELSVNVGW